MHATLQQLRLFEAVVRHGSITLAAREANLTQPAVSIQIRRLEDHAQMPLLDQVGKRMHPTSAGRELLKASQNILREMADLDGALQALRGQVAGPVRVSAVTTAQYFMPHLLGEFVRRYPDVQPSMEVTNRERLITRIDMHLDDVYIMGQVPERMDVINDPFLENKMVVVAHPDHPFAKVERLALEDLVRGRMLVREPGSGTRQAVDRMLASRGLSITPFMELGSVEALKQGVMAGLGVAVISQHSIPLELALHRLAIVNCESFPLRRPWYAVQMASRRQPEAVRKFLDFLHTEGAGVIGDLVGE